MKAVIAIDSLKGSLKSMEAGYAAAEGIRRVFPDAETVVCPLADGGEGTVDALVSGMNGAMQTVTVSGPLGRPVECQYGIIQSTRTAIIEMSSAAGITLVSQEERNPLNMTTFGVGQMIKDAIDKNCRRFIVGIGGSATNDGGIGMLQALGYGFLDDAGNSIEIGAKGMEKLSRITTENVIPELAECLFYVACDVTNPLCGELGCSAVFGPQKGATPTMVKEMDRMMDRYAKIAAKTFPRANPELPGTGAAGGMGFAFLTFTNAVLESGIQVVLKETALEEHIKEADIVVTGEGCLDGQTAMGKAPVGVARLAKKYSKPVIAFSGAVTKDAIICNQNGIDAFFPIIRSVVTLEEAMRPEVAKANMCDTVEQVFRLIALHIL